MIVKHRAFSICCSTRKRRRSISFGQINRHGHLTEPDETLVFQWFEKSAQQQYAPGEFLLACATVWASASLRI